MQFTSEKQRGALPPTRETRPSPIRNSLTTSAKLALLWPNDRCGADRPGAALVGSSANGVGAAAPARRSWCRRCSSHTPNQSGTVAVVGGFRVAAGRSPTAHGETGSTAAATSSTSASSASATGDRTSFACSPSMPDVEVRWICDRDPERLERMSPALSRRHGDDASSSDLLDDPELDAVLIATPVFTHFDSRRGRPRAPASTRSSRSRSRPRRARPSELVAARPRRRPAC